MYLDTPIPFLYFAGSNKNKIELCRLYTIITVLSRQSHVEHGLTRRSTMNNTIKVTGARIHNLKNIDIEIPKGKLTVITGVSGSGKSSFAFDTLYEEGKRRYLMFSNTQFMVDNVPAFDSITGLSPTVAVEQRVTRQSNPRSTVGTRTKINAMLAALFAAYGSRDPGYDDGAVFFGQRKADSAYAGAC